MLTLTSRLSYMELLFISAATAPHRALPPSPDLCQTVGGLRQARTQEFSLGYVSFEIGQRAKRSWISNRQFDKSAESTGEVRPGERQWGVVSTGTLRSATQRGDKSSEKASIGEEKRRGPGPNRRRNANIRRGAGKED